MKRINIIVAWGLVILLCLACSPVTANNSENGTAVINKTTESDNLSGIINGTHLKLPINTTEPQSEITRTTPQKTQNGTPAGTQTTEPTLILTSTTIQPKVLASPVDSGGTINRMQNTQNAMKGIMIVTVRKGGVTTKNSGAATSDSIDNVLIRKDVTAYLQKNLNFSLNEFDNLPTIEILNQNSTVIYSTKFSYQEVMTVPMQMPGQIQDSSPSQIQLAPSTTLVLPYLPDGQKIRIIDENRRIAGTVPLENYGIIDKNPISQDSISVPSSPGYFHILILASGYTTADMYKFTYRAEQVQNIISAAQPFNSKSQSIAVSFYPNTNDVGCYTGCAGIDRLLCCDDTKVISAAVDSGTLFDEIIVIHNTATYAGSGSRDFGTYKTNSYSSFGTVYDGSYSGIMALHEFGHSFGDLCDEYSYGTEGYSYYPCVNCRASCSDWSSFSSICTLGCDARSDFFRPENSVMLDLKYTTYNQASIKAEYSPDGLEQRLNFFLTTDVAANFVATPTSGNAPLTVQFIDTSTGSPTSWSWNFGDGNSSTEKNPSHKYSSAGAYSVALTATNLAGSNTFSRSNYITVSSGVITPVANFTGTPTSGTAPLPVSFTDLSTNTPTGWAWFFGDETYTQAWTEVNASSGWTPRMRHTSVVMPDGSIVLMGGQDNDGYKNDTWLSTDNGATWTLVNASSGWTPRMEHTSVVTPEGSIVLSGGHDGSARNDVWRSTDKGTTWTLMNASAGWAGRYEHSSVVLPDGSIVLMGGWISPGYKNDTWRSTDNGATWTLVNASSGWSARVEHSSVALPDGSILLLGGYDGSHKNDTWRSTDNGVTWIQVNASSGWSARVEHRVVAMPDGGIVLMGGYDNADNFKNDVWQCNPAGSFAPNPSHTYANIGTYTVSLTATNAAGSNTKTVADYITVTRATSESRTGVYRPGDGFYLKSDNGNTWISPPDLALTWDNINGDLPLAGNWSGDGKSNTGMYRPGAGFYLKSDNSNTWTSNDLHLTWDNAAGDCPIAGDWNADGMSETGVYRPGDGFYLKMDNGNTWTSDDFHLTWDNAAGDRPIAGDWNADGTSETGVYRPGDGFYLKIDNINSPWNSNDLYLTWDNAAGDRPIAGDWNADGSYETGVYRPGDGFYLKMDNINSPWTSDDLHLTWDTATGDLPIAGNFI